MTFECPHCPALECKGENKSSCCLDGRVLLAPLNYPHAFVKKFVKTSALLRQIQAYNIALGLTSIGTTVCDNVAIDTVYANGRQGVNTFRVQGTICLRIGTLLPEDGAEPSFAQVYVYDGDMEHQVDRRMKIIDGRDRTTANDFSSP
ncbi:Helitron helicase [Phytophthora megakarya]|uniref:Helitron helicase n=1 Tax=Phytophthora megakarya TaxID=4795 RepID=A0A225WQT8_9STRA|nr:Helitron helicase [Phytophthora megakarya]